MIACRSMCRGSEKIEAVPERDPERDGTDNGDVDVADLDEKDGRATI